jgi:hypothetical protein
VDGDSWRPDGPTLWERVDDWSERHGCLVIVVLLVGFPLTLTLIIGALYWLGNVAGGEAGAYAAIGIGAGFVLGWTSARYFHKS